MRQLIDQSAWSEFAAKAHKIKPSFKMVGLGVLSARVEQLERAKSTFDPVELLQDFASFEAEVAQALNLVQAELDILH